jgi:LmbE family N-acetylglucosaminyl deacetylase
MNVLVIAPHPDDEAIGCGGTVCLHADRADRVTAVFLTSGELGLKHLPPEQARRVREAEAEAAANVLGVASVSFLRLPDWGVGDEIDRSAAALRPVLERAEPELVYVPHADDAHPDHVAALPVLRAAIAGASRASAAASMPVPSVLAYEVWTPMGEFDHVEDITAVMRRKLKAVRCHASQMTEFRYDQAIRGLNRYRGALAARCTYAEVFRSVEM